VGVDEHGGAVGLDLRINPGETTVLLAPNGWGKTTLCDALGAGLPVARGSAAHVPGGLHYFPADATLFPSLSCEEFLRLGGLGVPAGASLNGLAGRRIGSLSGGERKRLQLLQLERVPDGAVVVMDEPLASMDRQRIGGLLAQLRGRRGQVTFFLLAPRHL
jgi:ABC-type multidrug transport system ATPase subunit